MALELRSFNTNANCSQALLFALPIKEGAVWRSDGHFFAFGRRNWLFFHVVFKPRVVLPDWTGLDTQIKWTEM